MSESFKVKNWKIFVKYNNFLGNEKIQPYPPAYTEIYPAVNANVGNNDQMGWRQPEQMPPTNENLTTPIMSQPIQPPPYGGTQQQQSNQPGKKSI